MSDEKEDRDSSVSEFLCDAGLFSPILIYGAVLGPLGAVVGALSGAVLVAALHNTENSPKGSEPNDRS